MVFHVFLEVAPYLSKSFSQWPATKSELPLVFNQKKNSALSEDLVCFVHLTIHVGAKPSKVGKLAMHQRKYDTTETTNIELWGN